MAFAKIPLSFKAMNTAYPDNQTLPPEMNNWLEAQHVKEKDHNDRLDEINAEHAMRGEPPEGKQWSTSCCMQVSVSFNKIGAPIPKAGSRRDNLLLGGAFHILAVDEFFTFLSRNYGPTDTFVNFDHVQDRSGVVIMGRKHIELFDGDTILQSADGLKKYAKLGRKTGAVMSPEFIASARPYYFWELTGDGPAPDPQAQGDIPDWLVGWWTVWDGNTYYYYFFKDGTVVYIEEPPNKHWTPPKTIHNRGSCVRNEKAHGFKVTWNLLSGETTPTIEDFTPLGWTSQKEMNAVSNKYSPIYAKRLDAN